MSLYEFNKEDALRFANENHYKTIEKNGELVFRVCPYCKKSAKSETEKFAINLTTGQFHCFRASCGVRGNMITLAKDFDFDLGQKVNEYYNRKKQYKDLSRVKPPEPKPAAVKYLESRGISARTAEAYHITVQKDHENVLVFPFMDEQGVIQFVKYRKTDFDKEKDKCKEWCEPNCKPILFGMHNINFENKRLIMTEGQLDSLACVEAGIENVVSVPTGANGFTWIPYCWDFLKRFETLIIFGDCEKGHITLLEDMKHHFDGIIKHVRDVDYKGCKDANEILQKHGTTAIKAAVENAIIEPIDALEDMANVKRVDLSKLEKIETGIKSLDRKIGGFYFGQLILLTGERGLGKSTLASQFGIEAIRQGYTTYFYSGELMDWYFKAWIDQQIAGRENIVATTSDYTGYTSYSVRESVLGDIETWYRGKAYIQKNDKNENVLDVAEKAIKQYGCRVVFIDNLMTALTDDISSDLYRQQTAFTRKLAELAKINNVIIFLVAHPRKRNGSEFGNDDIAGSSNITNLCDLVMQYTKPDNEDVADVPDRVINIYKNRLTGRVTRGDEICLWYEESSKRISDGHNFDWVYGFRNTDDDGFVKMEDDEIEFD